MTTRRSYDAIAGLYAERINYPADEYTRWRDGWAADLPAGAWVLDAGAGPGHHAAAFAAAGLRAVATDLSPAMAAIARDRVPGVADAAAAGAVGAGAAAAGRALAGVILADHRWLPFAAGTFTGVWASATLLHVPRAEAPRALAEWRRVTAGGGTLALSTATGGTDGWEDPPYDTGDTRPPPRWFVYHDEPGLLPLLDAAGWAVTSVDVWRSQRDWLRVTAVAAG